MKKLFLLSFLITSFGPLAGCPFGEDEVRESTSSGDDGDNSCVVSGELNDTTVSACYQWGELENGTHEQACENLEQDGATIVYDDENCDDGADDVVGVCEVDEDEDENTPEFRVVYGEGYTADLGEAFCESFEGEWSASDDDEDE